MPTHAEQKTVPYTQGQLFTLIADVEQYPEFLPWCQACRITKKDENVIYADLVVGYKMIREKFGSRVTLDEPDHIHVEYLSGPMKHLSNHWKFIPEQNGSCTIDFYVDFEFKSRILQGLTEMFFNEAVKVMVHAFEKRAKELYG